MKVKTGKQELDTKLFCNFLLLYKKQKFVKQHYLFMGVVF